MREQGSRWHEPNFGFLFTFCSLPSLPHLPAENRRGTERELWATKKTRGRAADTQTGKNTAGNGKNVLENDSALTVFVYRNIRNKCFLAIFQCGSTLLCRWFRTFDAAAACSCCSSSPRSVKLLPSVHHHGSFASSSSLLQKIVLAASQGMQVRHPSNYISHLHTRTRTFFSFSCMVPLSDLPSVLGEEKSDIVFCWSDSEDSGLGCSLPPSPSTPSSSSSSSNEEEEKQIKGNAAESKELKTTKASERNEGPRLPLCENLMLSFIRKKSHYRTPLNFKARPGVTMILLAHLQNVPFPSRSPNEKTCSRLFPSFHPQPCSLPPRSPSIFCSGKSSFHTFEVPLSSLSRALPRAR